MGTVTFDCYARGPQPVPALFYWSDMSTIVTENARRLGIFCFYNAKGHAPRYVHVFLEALMPHLSELAVVVNGATIVTENARRLGIFCFYNAKGHAPRYVHVFLEALMPHLSELAVVVNGALDDESREMFSEFASKIIVKDNEGLDVAAYRMGMLDYGWDALEAFDEVICLNDTVMGPVRPFAEMFETMDSRDVDFWGITTYPAETLNGEEIPAHLQAYWHAYRRALVASPDFRQYWEHLEELCDYAEVTREHEMKFTARFEGLGFTWDSYIDTGKFAALTPYPMLYAPMELLRDTPCPVFKRRSFFLDYDFYADQTVGQPALELYEYVRDHTDYDSDLIWDAVLPYYNIGPVAKAMHLNYVLPQGALNVRRGAAPRAAFIFHIFFLDMLDVTFDALSVLPEGVDLFVTCAPEKVDAIAEYANAHSFSKRIEFVPVQNRGRDVSALLVGACDVVLSRGYEVIGFAHDKKSAQNQQSGSHGSISQGFTYKLMQNTLGSRDYVENILTLFADDPRLGLVCPPPPFQGIYYPVTMPNDWGPNFEMTRELLQDRLGIDVPLDPRISTRSALGSCYWFRVDALRPLFEHRAPRPAHLHALRPGLLLLVQGRRAPAAVRARLGVRGLPAGGPDGRRWFHLPRYRAGDRVHSAVAGVLPRMGHDRPVRPH